MKVIVGILLILLFVIMIVLLSIVSYLLWDEVCDTYQKNRRRAIKTKQLEDEMKRVCDEPRTCSVNGRPFDECGFCEYFNCDTCKCEADVPQTERKESER